MNDGVGPDLMRKCTLGVLIFLCCVFCSARTTPTYACGPYNTGVVRYPFCHVPVAAHDEELIQLGARSGAALSSVAIGEPESIVTQVIEVEVLPTDKKLYVALVSSDAVIWRFHGAVESIFKIAAFGSTEHGSEYVGIVGIPKKRIHFVDPKPLVYQKSAPGVCVNRSKACHPGQYFLRYPAKGSERFAVRRPVTYLQSLDASRPETVPAGLVPKGYMDRPLAPRLKKSVLSIQIPKISVTYGNAVFSSHKMHPVVKLDAGRVISPLPVRPYSVLPVENGVRQLIARDHLSRKGTPRYRDAYSRWEAQRTIPYLKHLYKSHFSYVLTSPVEHLPARAPNARIRVLIDGDISVPAGHQNTCYAFVSGKSAGPKDCSPANRAGQTGGKDEGNGVEN